MYLYHFCQNFNQPILITVLIWNYKLFCFRSGTCFANVTVVYNGAPICRDLMGDYVSRSACCCSAAGKAWTASEPGGIVCEKCPDEDHSDFAQICPGGKGYRHSDPKPMIPFGKSKKDIFFFLLFSFITNLNRNVCVVLGFFDLYHNRSASQGQFFVIFN